MTRKNNVLGNDKREKIAGNDERRMMMTCTAGARRVAGIMLYMIVWG